MSLRGAFLRRGNLNITAKSLKLSAGVRLLRFSRNDSKSLSQKSAIVIWQGRIALSLKILTIGHAKCNIYGAN
jgi:hypothetical protein